MKETTLKLRPISRFWKLLEKDQRSIYQIYIYAVLNGLVNLSLPLGIQTIINLIQGGEVSSSWIVLVFFVLLGIAFTGIFQVLQLRIVENIQHRIFARSSFEFAFRLPKLKLKQVDDIHIPELVNRFFDTLTIQKGLPKILIDFSLATFQVVFGLILLALYSPYFIILGFILFFLLYLIFRITGPKGLETSLLESKYKYQVAYWLEEIGRTNKSFKLNAQSGLHMKKSDALVANYLNARENHFKILIAQFQQFIGFKIILAAGLLVVGSLLVFDERMNLGQFVAAEIIIILILNSVEKVIKVIDTIYDVLTALEKIGFVTDLSLDENIGQYEASGETGFAIGASQLSFKYPDQEQFLIRNLNFRIPGGGKVSITGPSGSGKSTLLHLIAGYYEVNRGELLFDEVPFFTYERSGIYQQIGAYFPSNQLFVGSIYENITVGKDIDDKDLQEVIEILGLKSFIARQKAGILAMIDPGGRRLPRSIIQKLLIARAIAHKPRLLLLEDPLQLIEASEKNQIIDYIMAKERPWTVVVVADYEYWNQKSDQIITLIKN